ncbi:MAG TPA: DUF1800 domain-containing protein [Blastocatellia bacterium]|nr:DUF1800 domain-containing protein [Blastocatellia bacterium]
MKLNIISGAFRLLSLAVAASFALGAVAPAVAGSGQKKASRKLSEDQRIIHVLNRLGYGPRPGDVERVRRMGLGKYIDQQLRPESIDDAALQARLSKLASLKMTVAEIYDRYPAPQLVARELGLRMPGQPGSQEEGPEAERDQRETRRKILAYYSEKGLRPPALLLQELQSQKILRAVLSERQLQEVMTDFWYNHFNIFWAKGADRWLTTDFEMNAIRPNTMGKFKDLLLATAKSPAMLFYLDNFQSTSPNMQMPVRRPVARDGNRQQSPVANQILGRRRGINENYARELMELHTLGVDGGYTQKDVQEVARCLTGWSIEQPRQSGKFIFRPRMHDNGEKVVLGQKIPAGGGQKDGEMVIDILSRHPSTARFISTKLVRRFTSDTPPERLVDRVASVYMKTGGDIREMLRTIFTSGEFFSPEVYRTKIKSPFELAASAIRALGGDLAATQQTAQFISKMGQPLYMYQPPTGYPDKAEQWVNTGALLERLNFGLALSSNRLRGVTVDMKRVASKSNETRQALDRAITILLNGDVSPQTRSILDRQIKEGVPVKGELDPPSGATGRNEADEEGDTLMADDQPGRRPGNRNRARGERRLARLGLADAQVKTVTMSAAELEAAKVFGLVLGSPEFQRR